MFDRVAASALLVIACAVPARAVTEHASLRFDFSQTQNPQSGWAYLQAGAPIGCALHEQFLPELTGWSCVSSWDAAVAEITGVPNPAFWHDAQQGDIVMHVASSIYPGPIAVTWTATHAGVALLSGVAWDAFFAPDRDASWTLTLNNTVLASRDSIRGVHRGDFGSTFFGNLAPGQSLKHVSIAVGDVIAFTTHATTPFGHFMGVDVEIDLNVGAACAGDTNGDGMVDFTDLNRVLSSFGLSQGAPGFIAGADLNGDHVVDFIDLNIVLSFYGAIC